MKKNSQTTILAFLVIIMIFVWFSTFKKINSKMSRRKAHSQSPAISKQFSDEGGDFLFWQDKAIKSRRPSEFREWGRNPFILVKVITDVSKLNLMGISWDENLPQAIINEIIVNRGDVIDGNEVIKIFPDRVILRGSDQERIELKLWREEEK